MCIFFCVNQNIYIKNLYNNYFVSLHCSYRDIIYLGKIRKSMCIFVHFHIKQKQLYVMKYNQCSVWFNFAHTVLAFIGK